MNLLLGIGHPRHGDDALGVVFAKCFKHPDWLCIPVYTTPENYVARIRRLQPAHLVLLDACEMGTPPGTRRLLHADNLQGLSFGTHAPSIQLLLTFLKQDMPELPVSLIGIQPVHRFPQTPLSQPIRQTLRGMLTTGPLP